MLIYSSKKNMTRLKVNTPIYNSTEPEPEPAPAPAPTNTIPTILTKAIDMIDIIEEDAKKIAPFIVQLLKIAATWETDPIDATIDAFDLIIKDANEFNIISQYRKVMEQHTKDMAIKFSSKLKANNMTSSVTPVYTQPTPAPTTYAPTVIPTTTTITKKKSFFSMHQN